MLKKHLIVAVLKKFVFGNTFISWIRLIYAYPQARVHTNDTCSEYFKLGMGHGRAVRSPLCYLPWLLSHCQLPYGLPCHLKEFLVQISKFNYPLTLMICCYTFVTLQQLFLLLFLCLTNLAPFLVIKLIFKRVSVTL